MRIDVELHGFPDHEDSVAVDEPDFATYTPDLDAVREKARHHEVDHLVVVGNGGSITTCRAFCGAFDTDAEVHHVTTMDPDRLARVAELPQHETLVMPISRSGTTTGVLEAFLHLRDHGFPGFTVTGGGALGAIAEREGMDRLDHPPLGGRFSGTAETGLAPAAFAGIDIEGIRTGAERAYDALAPGDANDAARLAAALHTAEQDGSDQVFAGIYPSRLWAFRDLLVQLFHETVCKEGAGGTVFTGDGPEFQHHTNQRLFGGPADVVPVFVRAERHGGGTVRVPDDLADIDLRGRQLGDLEGEDLEDALHAEERGVREALEDAGRPHAVVTLPEITPGPVGELAAFLQYTAVYAAALRGVDPFSEPDVAASKAAGFAARFR